MSDAQAVSVLGMGRMGAEMARTLRREGFDVCVFNRTHAKAAAVAEETGAHLAETATEAAAGSPIVISILADDASVESVWTEAAPGLTPGSVVLEMSTIDPSTLLVIQPAIERAGATLLDAPVSGSVQLVEQGALTIMVGGDATGLETARPVLEALGNNIFHLGELGSGATIKLAVNSMIHSINIALSEALVLAEKAGVDRKRAYEVFATSAASAPYVHYKRAAFEEPETATVAFDLDLVAKDLDLILGLGERVGAPLTQGAVNREVVGRAIAAGMGNDDLSAIATYLRRSSE